MTKKFDWKSLVGTVAPKLATALHGPLAGMAVQKIAKVFNIEGDPDTLESKIESRLENATSEDLLALKEANYDFQVQMKELGIREKDLYFKDMANARLTHKDSHKPFVIFLILSVICCAGFWFLTTNLETMSDTTKGMLLPIYGGVVAKWMDTVAYHVGTTWSSARKDSFKLTA